MKWILLSIIFVASSLALNDGDWSGRVNIDTMTDDEVIVMSTYNSMDLLGALFLGTDLPEFIIIFPQGSDTPLIGVNFNKNIGSRNSTCLTRIDDKPAEEYQVVIDGEGIFLSIGSDLDTKKFFADLLRGNEFMVRFTPAGRSQETVSFSLSGITGLSRQLGIDVDYYLSLSEQQTSSGGVAPHHTLKNDNIIVGNACADAVLEIHTDFLGRTFDVYVKSVGESSWGSVWNTGDVDNSYNVYFDIQPGVYDIRIEIDNGEVYIQNNVNVVDWYTIEVNLRRV